VFSLLAMKQHVTGLIDVFDDHVRVEVTLPWLLNRIGWTSSYHQAAGHADAR
jgi:hypothetical protein